MSLNIIFSTTPNCQITLCLHFCILPACTVRLCWAEQSRLAIQLPAQYFSLPHLKNFLCFSPLLGHLLTGSHMCVVSIHKQLP